MNILVTGGAGFIGSSLVERLVAEGHRVDVLDNLSTGRIDHLDAVLGLPAVTLLPLDITSPTLPRVQGHRHYDLVYHLAAQTSVAASVRDPFEDSQINVLGTLNVAELARVAGAPKVVYAASGGTLYGDVADDQLPIRETTPHRPASPYGASKKAGLDYLLTRQAMGDFAVTALALANVYGPRQDPTGEAGVIAIFATNLLSGLPCLITGDGKQTRDFVHVDDVVEAFVLAGTSAAGEGELLHVGSGLETSVNDVFEELVRATGVQATATHVPARPGEVRRNALAIEAAARVLGWHPSIGLPQGLERLISTLG